MGLLYKVEPGGGIRISKLDAVSAVVLSAVGGATSVRRVISRSRTMGLQEAPPRAFRDLIEGAVRAGVLRLEMHQCA